jgi:hypothetical protein
MPVSHSHTIVMRVSGPESPFRGFGRIDTNAMSAAELAPRRVTQRKRPEDEDGLRKGKILHFAPCCNQNQPHMFSLVRKRSRQRRRAWQQGERARRKIGLEQNTV